MMNSPKTLKHLERQELLDKLHRAYVEEAGMRRKLNYLWKRYAWICVTRSSYLTKRILDIIVASVILTVLAPLMLFVAFLIKLHDGGPVFYICKRIGRWGEPFLFPKFRSMVIDADALQDSLKQFNQHAQSKTFKIKNDPRITWIGRIIRKTSIDELPQLWCVLKGEMSLVGPRPPLPSEVKQYTIKERRRLDITPGITCFWQVSGRADIPFDKQVELDIRYIESQSFREDIKILLKTIPAVVLGKGAY